MAAGGRKASGRAAGSRHVALLRGLNVGGRNRLPMSALVALFEEAGAREVATYIQSGNVVFTAAAALARRLPALVSSALAERHGIESVVILRSAAELGKVMESNPFLPGADEKSLHVAFLASRPAPARLLRLDPARSPPDEWRALGRELYLWLPGGVAKTKLSNAWIDRSLETTSTVRNWATVRALAERAASPGRG